MGSVNFNLGRAELERLMLSQARDRVLMAGVPSCEVTPTEFGEVRRGNLVFTSLFEELDRLNGELAGDWGADADYAPKDVAGVAGNHLLSLRGRKEELLEAWAEFKDIWESSPKVKRPTKKQLKLLEGAADGYSHYLDVHDRLSWKRNQTLNRPDPTSTEEEAEKRLEGTRDYDLATDYDEAELRDENEELFCLGIDESRVKRFWASWKPGMTLCHHRSSFYRIHDIMDDAEYVLNTRKRAPRVKEKPMVQILSLTSYSVDGRQTEWSKDSNGWHTITDRGERRDIDVMIFKNIMTDALRRWAWKSHLKEYKATLHSFGSRPGSKPPQIIKRGARKYDTVQTRPVEVRRYWCMTCAKWAEDMKLYEDFLKSKNGMIVTRFRDSGELGVKTFHVRDNVNHTEVQKRLMGQYWAGQAYSLRGNSGNWACLCCGSQIMATHVEVSWYFRSKSNTIWHITAKVGGDLFLKRLLRGF